jgi:dipeptidyl aminopeptidase/acylaminoacyl peptidase
MLALALLSLVSLLGAPAQAPARPALDAAIAQFARLAEVRDVALSPDGQRLAWGQSLQGPHGALPDKSALFLLDLGKPGAKPQPLSACKRKGGCDEGEPVFSPDSRSVAFLSDAAKPGQRQLFVATAAGGPARSLTALVGATSDPRWSPDSAQVALLVIEGDVDAAGPLGPAAREVGVMQEVIHERRIAVVPAAGSPQGGPAKLVSPDDLFVYEYDWSPDGQQFVYAGAHGSGDDNWWIAELFTQAASGGAATSILKPPYQLAQPRWSPDGKSVAFIGGLMSDEGLTGGDLFVLPLPGGAPRNVTDGRKSSMGWFQWTGPDAMLVAEWAQGETALSRLEVSDGAFKQVFRGAQHPGPNQYALSLCLAADGETAAFISQGWKKPQEVYTDKLSVDAPATQRSHANDGQQPAWGEVRSLRWQNDGFDEQGWLVAPTKVEPGKTYPMITAVHGGPSWAVPAHFTEEAALYASAGYYLFLPNPRGSFGQGEAYTKANVKDFGGGDLRDVLAGVDAALKAAPIDPARLGLTGWSYGGYMTMWAVPQTQRFSAAVAGAGISNWQSYYGQNKIDTWMLPFFGAAIYDDPAVYRRASPIEFIKAAKTPTLILQGERDAEVPAPQALEFWHALKALKVPTQLVIYEGEGHVFRKPVNKRDRAVRMLGWFDQHLAPRQ